MALFFDADPPGTVPHSSLAKGLAGMAYAALRAAELTGEGRFAQRAEVYADAARIRVLNKVAPVGNPDEEAPPHSLWYSAPGVYCIAAACAAMLGKYEEAAAYSRMFTESCGPAEGDPDATLGVASSILGALFLMERLRRVDALLSDRLFITERRDCLGRAINSVDLARTGDDSPLGFAHGLCGILYAAVLSDRFLGSESDEQVFVILDNIIASDLHVDASRGRSAQPSWVRSSWCNGSAGFVPLLLAAFELTGKSRYLAEAERAAVSCVEDASVSNPSLCCGITGHIFALLSLFRATNEQQWVVHAQRLLCEASAAWDKWPNDDPRLRYSLFHGRLGSELVQLELCYPRESRMPMVEP